MEIIPVQLKPKRYVKHLVKYFKYSKQIKIEAFEETEHHMGGHKVLFYTDEDGSEIYLHYNEENLFMVEVFEKDEK